MRMASFARNAALLIAVAGIPIVAQQNTGYLKTNVNPGRAGVFVDGKYLGPAGNFGWAGNTRSLPASMKSHCQSRATKMWSRR